MRSVLLEAIAHAGQSFDDGELAFLALTSKVERPFLDRVAFAAQSLLMSRDVVVAREFAVAGAARADLAFLENFKVICVVEGKAMTVADCTRREPRRRQYAELLQPHLQRYLKATIPNAEIYSLLLGVHPLTRLPTELRPVVKYISLMNAAYSRLGSAERIHDEANRALQSYLRDGALISSGAFQGGEAFGVAVDLHWWCYGPFRSPNELGILRENAA